VDWRLRREVGKKVLDELTSKVKIRPPTQRSAQHVPARDCIEIHRCPHRRPQAINGILFDAVW